MKISIYPTVRSHKPEVCDWDTFLNYTQSKSIMTIAQKVRKAIIAQDTKTKDELKKTLPAVTWQAWFDGQRKNDEAHPTGLFMLDVDHLKVSPEEVYTKKVAGKIEELGIVAVHKTISCEGLRVVAFCRPEFKTLYENQRWLAENLMLDLDEACKDWARSSFLVPFEYFFFLKGEIFNPTFEAPFVLPNTAESRIHTHANTTETTATQDYVSPVQRQYKGKDLYEIAMLWLKQEYGGLPQEGERNTALYKLATRMKYITDFNPRTIAYNIPHCGLPDEEIMSLCSSACSGARSVTLPKDFTAILEKRQDEKENEPIETPPLIQTTVLPALPPIFSEFVDIAPDDFKPAVILCLLPMVGTLGSRLRATYINGKVETPSFMVALEAPQASGKSFIEDVAAIVLDPIKQKDEAERQKEKEFEEQIKKLKTAGTGTKAERAEVRELLDNKPVPIIRYMPATASITKLLIRMDNAGGLHLFALSPEVDTVAKAFKRGFSNLSDLLRCGFDNSEFGQEYATDTSFSGKVRVFYNTLYSGTPGAMRRFYNDSEDGTMSRTLFVTIPDQFGKPMPVWKKFTEDQLNKVTTAIGKLYCVSIRGDEIQKPYMMDLEPLNIAIDAWNNIQRETSVKFNDRTRNIFYRRCAEVAFRAGMIAYYLYSENPKKMKDVIDFSLWIADMMLSQFLVRINISNDDVELGNLFARQVYMQLDDEFTRTQLEAKLKELGFRSSVRSVLSKWKQAGKIQTAEKYGSEIIKKTHSNGKSENKS